MRLKLFFIAFLASFVFWGGVNVFQKELEDFLFLGEMAKNSQVFLAQVRLEEKLEERKPIRNPQVEDFQPEAKSITSVLINSEGVERVLFEKEGDEKLPIASLTKLMTTNVILKNYDLSQTVKISEAAVKQKEDFGALEVDETFTVKNLLYSSLMESSNDAAFAIVEIIGEEKFVTLMNSEVKKLGLTNTHFSNPTGLDDLQNFSTAKDLTKLTAYLLKEPLFWRITSTSEFDLYTLDETFHHKIINTNELLGEIPSIVGGKTGETPQAKGCLLLVIEAPEDRGYLINIILGSEDRFGEMERLVDWLNLAYKW